MLVYPVCDVALDTPSAHEFAEGFGFTRAAMRHYWELYLAGADGRHPDASPLRAPWLRGLPPALVITAESDPLRDEGEAYAACAARCRRARVVCERYPGTVHGFWRWTAPRRGRRARGRRGRGVPARGAHAMSAHVVVAGGGFSGVTTAAALLRRGVPGLRVTLADRTGTFGRGVAYAALGTSTCST